jgi:hypothetical protein
VLQELDLPQCPHTEHGVVERGDTFDGHLGSRRDMYGGSVTGTEANMTKSAVLGSAKMFRTLTSPSIIESSRVKAGCYVCATQLHCDDCSCETPLTLRPHKHLHRWYLPACSTAPLRNCPGLGARSWSSKSVAYRVIID